MIRLAFKRRIGCGAALIAAYALAFNVILSSILIAGIPPLVDVHELCISSVDANAAPADTNKSGGKAAIHCPLCAGHHGAGSMPQPSPGLADRIPLRVEADYALQERIFARARSFAHLSRGPPALT